MQGKRGAVQGGAGRCRGRCRESGRRVGEGGRREHGERGGEGRCREGAEGVGGVWVREGAGSTGSGAARGGVGEGAERGRRVGEGGRRAVQGKRGAAWGKRGAVQGKRPSPRRTSSRGRGQPHRPGETGKRGGRGHLSTLAGGTMTSADTGNVGGWEGGSFAAGAPAKCLPVGALWQGAF